VSASIAANGVRDLGRESAALEWADVPTDVQDRTLLVTYDTLGVMIAGARITEVRALAGQHTEIGSAPLVGLGTSSTSNASCWVNGAAVCALELDEGSKYARGHPAAHVMPAALAWGAVHDGETWLSAVLAGYEVAARFGRATRLHNGVHPHGTWGGAGAAATSARLGGLDADGIASAIDIATGMTLAPHFESALSGDPVRSLWVGAANVVGLEAARLAASGSTAVNGIAARTYGELIGTLDPEPLSVPFEDRFEIMLNYFKRHAACAYTHPAVDAVLAMLEEMPIPIDEVDSVNVETFAIASALDRIEWPTRLASMFSIPFVVAVAMSEGEFGPSGSDETHRNDPRIATLAKRTTVAASEEFEARLPDRRGARVSVTMRDGSRREAVVEQPVGDAAGATFGWIEVRSKITALIGHARAQQLEEVVVDLPGGTIEKLFEALRGGGSA
jgi:2-methylcitrate dehydratase PrpD